MKNKMLKIASVKENRILCVIPARGGSKGIPQKNLRNLCGKPLIYYAITTAKKSEFKLDVVVTTDDDSIGSLSEKFGAVVIKRHPNLAKDDITLDPVIYDAMVRSQLKFEIKYDIVITMQCTSPLLKSETLDKAINNFLLNDYHTMISVYPDSHLAWRIEGKHPIPLFGSRKNRQELDPIFKETGSFLISSVNSISKETRIGHNVGLFIMPDDEHVDIDSYQDWAICEYVLSRKCIAFVVVGTPIVGLGHVQRAILLANELVDAKIIFVIADKDELAYDTVSSYNYECIKTDNVVATLSQIKPDLVINDILDTSIAYMNELKKIVSQIINFEDLGPGSHLANAVINALYAKHGNDPSNYYSGVDYFCLRDEFIYTQRKKIGPDVKNILITFGGTDPGNFTLKVLDALRGIKLGDVRVDAILGLGYSHLTSFSPNNYDYNLKIWKNVKNISDFIYNADIVFTAGGRTVFEIASIGVPAIVLTQNNRENLHTFACEENGFINLGIGKGISRSRLKNEIRELVMDFETRKNMSLRMQRHSLINNKKNVVRIIRELLS